MPDQRAGGVPMQGGWTWDWFDASPLGETYGVRREDEVLCYTNRYEQGYADALLIAKALNAYAEVPASMARLPQPAQPTCDLITPERLSIGDAIRRSWRRHV